MNFNNFTIIAQEAVQKAIDLAQANSQQMIEPAHVLKGVMMVGENVTNFLFQKLGVNVRSLETAVDKEIESYPRVSGGEPMLRADFAEIFDYMTKNSLTYTLNTNGTLITPKLTKLLKRKGIKLIALYGANAGVHDHITRRSGSFEELMRGVAYLKEAGAGFTVQIVPMRDNYHQYQEMIKLAESLSPSWRLGAAWLYLSAHGDEAKNHEIIQQCQEIHFIHLVSGYR